MNLSLSMKMLYTFILLLTAFYATIVLGQTNHSIYSGQEQREIKSLSHAQINGYLNAKGMGFAKAAELNHYPGPKHVLELSTELSLSNEQIQKTKSFFNEMYKMASQLGKVYVQKEKELDALFATQDINEIKLNTLLLEIGEINSKIRFAHLNAHLKMKEVLSEEQIKKYDQHRGYNSNKLNIK